MNICNEEINMKEYKVIPSRFNDVEGFKPFKDISEMTPKEKNEYCNFQIRCAKCDACVWDEKCKDILVFVKEKYNSCEECPCADDNFAFVHCTYGGFLLDKDCDYSKECDPRCPLKECENDC